MDHPLWLRSPVGKVTQNVRARSHTPSAVCQPPPTTLIKLWVAADAVIDYGAVWVSAVTQGPPSTWHQVLPKSIFHTESVKQPVASRWRLVWTSPEITKGYQWSHKIGDARTVRLLTSLRNLLSVAAGNISSSSLRPLIENNCVLFIQLRWD